MKRHVIRIIQSGPGLQRPMGSNELVCENTQGDRRIAMHSRSANNSSE